MNACLDADPMRCRCLVRRFAFGALLWMISALSADAAIAPKKREAALAAALFTGADIPRLFIEIPEADMEILREQKRQNRRNPPRTNVAVSVREGGRLYTNVALHLKGSG